MERIELHRDCPHIYSDAAYSHLTFQGDRIQTETRLR
jgi:hypothetical protein